MSGALHSRARTSPGLVHGIFAWVAHSVLASWMSTGSRTFSGFTPAASGRVGVGVGGGVVMVGDGLCEALGLLLGVVEGDAGLADAGGTTAGVGFACPFANRKAFPPTP